VPTKGVTPIRLHPPRHLVHTGLVTWHPFAIHASQHALTVALLVTGAVAVSLAAIAAGVVSSRRQVRRRLSDLAQRLSADDPYAEHPNRMETVLARLEHAAGAATTTVSDSTDEVARLRAAIDSIPLGVVICDELGTRVFTNLRANQLMGSRGSELLAAQAVEEMLDACLSGTAASRTIELYGPPRRTLVIRTEPIEDAAKPLGVAAIVEDVSERTRLESVRRDFVANVSHELKTPVGAMALLAETLEAEDDVEIGRRLANRIHHEALRVSRIIDDLINLSRIEAAENPPTEPVSIATVLEDAIDAATSAAEQKGITIEHNDFPPDAIVLGDRRELLSAIGNLLENAIHYSDPGSRVWVRAVQTPTTVEISVQDEGIGIPTKDLDRIFERFYRVDQTRSRHNKGTGLGLSIVRHVVNRHQGDVTVSSHEGEGSTFTIVLPRQTSSGRPGPVIGESVGAAAWSG
jgi:two-component system sensor histidine kinase SenX3